MPQVTIVQVIYNHKRFIEPVFSAIFNQTFKDFNVVAVIAGNQDGGKKLLMEKFPQVEIIDPGLNIGFAAGHNLVFDKYQSDFFQLVNPDMLMEPGYIANILKAFDDPKVGAATGKLYQISQLALEKAVFSRPEDGLLSLDTTGVNISKSGRARDRGQHEIDNHQYDNLTSVDAVSGAGAMYRSSALRATKLPKLSTKHFLSAEALAKAGALSTSEYFDEDFHSYWEDVDLSWRMANAGWKNVFVPSAIGFHGRAAGSSEKGYTDVVGFIKHHKTLSPHVRQLNYKNHIFMYIKNSPYFYPQFFVREFFMLIYILLFEISTLKVGPEMFKLMPKMWKKRKHIKNKRPPEALAELSI